MRLSVEIGEVDRMCSYYGNAWAELLLKCLLAG